MWYVVNILLYDRHVYGFWLEFMAKLKNGKIGLIILAVITGKINISMLYIFHS
jgi:hypothetical protein